MAPMTTATINNLIAAHLGQLVYPGDEKNPPFALPLSMFRTDGQPIEAAEGYQTVAKLTAAAITNLIETKGDVTMVPNAELADLRAAAAANEHQRHREITFHTTCGARLFKANVTDFDKANAKISCQVIKAMQSLSPECGMGHEA